MPPGYDIWVLPHISAWQQQQAQSISPPANQDASPYPTDKMCSQSMEPTISHVYIATGVSQTDYINGIQTWLNVVQAPPPPDGDGLGVPPVIYTNRITWNTLGNPNQFTGYELWIAEWGEKSESAIFLWRMDYLEILAVYLRRNSERYFRRCRYEYTV